MASELEGQPSAPGSACIPQALESGQGVSLELVEKYCPQCKELVRIIYDVEYDPETRETNHVVVCSKCYITLPR